MYFNPGSGKTATIQPMRNLILIPAVLLFFFSGSPKHSFEKQRLGIAYDFQKESFVHSDSIPQSCITQSEAESILGQSARLSEKSSTMKETILQCKCTYTAISEDAKTGKTGKLYYMFEKYKDESSARKVFTDILTQNRRGARSDILQVTGCESFSHTDSLNFYLILARKGNKMLRFKVNRLTSKTSPDAVIKVAKRIISSL